MTFPTQTILSAAAPVFILLALGFGLRKKKILTEEADSTLMRLVIVVFYPALFLDFIIGNPALKEVPNLITAPLVGFFTTVFGFLCAYGLARLMGLTRGKGLRTFSFCNGINNFGYIPIPLIIALFDDRRTLGVLLVHNVGVEVAIWTVGIILLSGRFHLGALKRLMNPPIMAMLLALSINAVGLDGSIPEWVMRLVGMLGACSIPVGILLAGAGIADLLGKSRLFKDLKIPLGSIALRLCLLPAAFIALAVFMPGLSFELRQVILVQAAMPAGIFPIILARHYGGDPSVAVKVVVSTTLASVVTMPIWLQVGLRLIY